MLTRVVAVAAIALVAGPAVAEPLNADSARRFVIGKVFAFNCYEGTRGAGRIYADGSVAGSIQFRGQGPIHYAALPAGTLHVRGDAYCASVRGLPIQPCFNVNRTTTESFRGSVMGLNFAYCDFTQNNPRAAFTRTRARTFASRPLQLHAAAATTEPGEEGQ